MEKLPIGKFLEALFQELLQRPDSGFDRPRLKIAIVSTPRTGSTMVCDVLRNAGQFGEPREWFNLRYLKVYGGAVDNPNIDLPRYIGLLYRKTTTPNGVFAVNFHVDQYQALRQRANFDLLRIGFDRIYYVHRADKLAQALSYTKAKLTDSWSHRSTAARPLPPTVPRSAVLAELARIAAWEEFYRARLAASVDRELLYEEFSRSGDRKCFDRLAADCGIDAPPAWRCELRKMAGDEDRRYVAQLRAYLGGEPGS